MFKLFKFLRKKDWMLVVLAFGLVFAQVWLELKMPDYMSEITKLVVTEGSEMDDILQNGGKMLLCAVGSLISAIGVSYIISRVAATFSMNVRRHLFAKVLALDFDQAKKFSTSSLITRTTNDITQVQMVVATGTQMIIRAPLTVGIAISKIANKSWQWSTVTASAVMILLTSIVIIMAIVIPRFKILQKLTDKLNGVTRESLTGIRVIRAFNAEKYQENKFAKANNELSSTVFFTQKVMSIMSPLMYLVMQAVSLAIYFIGAILIGNVSGGDFISDITERANLFGDMVVFSSYAMQIIISFLVLAAIFMIVPRAQVSAKRINEVLDTVPEIVDGKEKNINTDEVGTIEFRNVSFKYPDAEEYMLRDISFKAKQGDTVAIIGSTGSGKSTLINLIPRIYDASEGEILVDGVNVRNYKEATLRNKIGYVPQKPVMFDGSVMLNVSYGDNGKERVGIKRIIDSIEVAQAKDFVEKMPKDYESHIAQGGTNVSGGQRQRLAIARAIARDPEIYIFDDSFSALDFKTDAALRKALKEYTNKATSVIVAQRISTIMHADHIIVLDDGECVGQGTHKELMKNCETYKQIAYSQLTKEELNV